MNALIPAVAAALVVVPALAQEPLAFDVRFNDTFLAAEPDRLSLGDRIIINDRLLKDGAEAGSAAGVCTIVDPATGAAICTISFTLSDGTLAAQFVNRPPPEKTFAVVGGTGAYAGRQGSGILVENGDETGRVSFELK